MKSSWRFEWNLQSRAFYLSVHYAFEGGSNFEYEDTNVYEDSGESFWKVYFYVTRSNNIQLYKVGLHV